MIDEQTALAEQQKDSLCGPFTASRILREAGISEWRGKSIDQDLVALHAGTTVPPHPDVPRDATSLQDYRYELPVVDAERAGTTAGGLAQAIALLSADRLECVPLRGPWRTDAVERLLELAPELRARLIANLRRGLLWSTHPSPEAILSELAGEPSDEPRDADWDVGHFVELTTLVRGHRGALVVVRDSYPSFGWMGHHLQPPRLIAEALVRGDGREGGILAVVPAERTPAARDVAAELQLELGLWDNSPGGGG